MKDIISFKKPAICVNIGACGAGKSNMLKYLLLKDVLNKKEQGFKFGIVFTRTKFNKDLDFLPDKYKYTEYKPELLKKYMNGLEKLKKETGKIPKNFVIFEDQQGLLNRAEPVLTNFLSSFRHYNCSCFLNFQYLYGASPLLREIATYCIMFSSNSHRTMNGLFENFGQLFENYNQFRAYFKKNTHKPYTAIVYEQKQNKLKKNYKRYKAPNMKDFKNFKLQY